MRIVFVNLHSDWMLVKTTAVLIFKFSAAIKHKYLLDYLLTHPEYEVCSYINDRGFSILRKGNETLLKFLNLFKYCEHRYIMKKNGIEHKKITVIKRLKDIRPDDMVILYNIMTDNYRGMSGVHVFKALSMLHFHGRAEEDKLIKEANISCFFNESNLQENSELFRKYYNIKKPWVVHPFVFQERFKPIKPFSERKNKVFSTGTITYKEHEEFLSVYGDPCDQPARKFVKDNPDFFKDTVDCYSSDYLEGSKIKPYLPTDNKLVRLYKQIHNRFNTGHQKSYFSFNMVDKFNEYKMCLVGEEILGVPGIGYVEGMACGCAYIGLDSPMYRDLGLIPGVHYISYDGTKEGLKQIVEYYQQDEHQAELEKIAQTGCEYVRKHFNGPAVAEQLINDLRKEQERWLSRYNMP